MLGSDAHNNKRRNFCLLDAYDFIGKEFSVKLVDLLKNNSKKVLNGKKVKNKDMSNENNKNFNLKEKIKNIFKLRGKV